MNKQGKLLILSGPSGVGKSTVISALMKIRDDIRFSVSATTRSPRPGETDGVNYFFVSVEEFEEMIRDGELLEYTRYVDNYYGTPKSQVCSTISGGSHVVLDIEIEGARNVKKAMPESVSVFIAPPSLQDLENRLRGRNTDSEEVIAKRLFAAEEQMRCSSEYDYVVVNDIPELAAERINAILNA